MSDHGQCRAKLFKERKHQANSPGNGLIGVQDNLTDWVIDQSNWQAKVQLPLLRFGHLPALQTLMQPMELGLRHVPFKSKQQAIIMRSGIIDGFFVDDQSIRESTNFQQAILIAARTSQTRDLQAQHGSNMPQTNFGYQPLKPITANGRGSRLSLILIHDLDLCL